MIIEYKTDFEDISANLYETPDSWCFVNMLGDKQYFRNKPDAESFAENWISNQIVLRLQDQCNKTLQLETADDTE
jgi:hypothetical protein